MPRSDSAYWRTDATAGTVRKALIPAAGRGTRLLPFSKVVPKELAPIVSTPALEYVVAEASGRGIVDVLVVLAPGKGAVADYFASNPGLESELAAREDEANLTAVRRAASLATIYQVEQDKPRGLGDAVAQGEEFAGGEPFAVLLPDDIIDDRDDLLGPMLDVFAEHGGVVLGLIDVPRADIHRYGCAALAESADPSTGIVSIVDVVEKPAPEDAPSTLAIIGRYILPPEVFDALRRTDLGAGGEVQLTDGLRRLAQDGVAIHGVIFNGRRYDTGNRLSYVQAIVQLAGRHPEIGKDFTAWLRDYVSELNSDHTEEI